MRKHLNTALVAGTIAAALCLGTSASAASWAWDLTDGGAHTGHGTFTTSDVLMGYDGYDILTFDGTLDGIAVSLIPNPVPGTPQLSPSGHYQFDQVFHFTPPHVDLYGWLFSLASGPYNEVNFYSPGGGPAIIVDWGTLDGASSQITTAILTVSSVPEPTTWALMILGFGLIGATLRRRHPVLA